MMGQRASGSGGAEKNRSPVVPYEVKQPCEVALCTVPLGLGLGLGLGPGGTAVHGNGVGAREGWRELELRLLRGARLEQLDTLDQEVREDELLVERVGVGSEEQRLPGPVAPEAVGRARLRQAGGQRRAAGVPICRAPQQDRKRGSAGRAHGEGPGLTG